MPCASRCVDEALGHIYCLSQAPSAEAAIAKVGQKLDAKAWTSMKSGIVNPPPRCASHSPCGLVGAQQAAFR